MYAAIIAPVTRLRRHRNAVRLQCAQILGHNVIVDETCKPGQLMVYFPAGGQLDERFARENHLLRQTDADSRQIGGYLDPKRRVIPVLRLRGEISDGLALPMEALGSEIDTGRLKEGNWITELNGVRLCRMCVPANMDIDTGTYTLVNYRGTGSGAKVVRVPWGVEVIRRFAFQHRTSVETVILPETVREIEHFAFLGCDRLKIVRLPGSVERIGYGAFTGCVSLRQLRLPSGVRCVEALAFDGCAELASLELPDTLTTLGRMAFRECGKLRCLHLPKGMREMGDVFNSDVLERVTLDPDNPHFAMVDGVLFNRDRTVLLRYPKWKRDARHVVPDGVRRMEDSAFARNGHLAEAILPDSVTHIGHRAFSNCARLQRIVIPPSVVDMGNCVFIGIHNTLKSQRSPFPGRIGKATIGAIRASVEAWELAQGGLICGRKGSVAHRYATREGCTIEEMR